MKKILIASTAALLSLASVAQPIQIDRTKQPKAGPAPTIKIKDPAQFKLANGMTVLVVENHKMPKVSANLTIDQGPIVEGKKAGVVNLMGSMLNEGTTKKSKVDFDEAVEMMGADVSLRSSGGYASSLTKYFDNTLMLMAEALRNPAFKQENFDKLKAQSITGLKSSEKSAKAISGRVYRALAYGKNSANGEFATVESTEGITLDDVKSAYKNYITPANAILTFVGDITPAQAKVLATKAFGTWAGKKLTLAPNVLVPNVKATEIDLVDVPSAVQSEITVLSLVNNPLSNPDYHALVVANYILGGGAEGKLFMNLREKHGFTYGSYSTIGGGRYQNMFNANASVRNEKVDSAVAEIVAEIKNMINGNITDEEFSTAKAVYNGSFALGMENPSNTATYATNILLNKLPKDYYRNFLTKINAVTKADIQRVAKKYFGDGKARIVVVGKADVVRPGLKKLGYPVLEYDKYANPVEVKAVADVPASNVPTKGTEVVTAESVINKYIDAIGGKAAASKITSMQNDITLNIQGMSIPGVEKFVAPNKYASEFTMQGMTAMKIAFNGTKGYQAQMGQKAEMEGDMLSMFKDRTAFIDQLNYFDGKTKVEFAGTEKFNGEDVYKLNVTKPGGFKASEFYSAKTGLLVKETTKVEAQGQSFDQETTFSNYKDFGGVKLATTRSTSVAGQELEFTLDNFKANPTIAAADFE